MVKNKTQKNILNEWIDVKLGDCLDRIEGGGTPSKKNVDFWSGLIPWASVKDIVTHNPSDTLDHITELGLKNSSSRLISKGTLIIPTRMALGHAVFFDVDVAINQDLKALYPKKELKKKFLFYWFEMKKDFIKKLGVGSTVSGIQQNELKLIKFLLPPLTEQNRIVAILETWDKYLEKLSRKIEIKKNIKKGLMQRLLTGDVRLKGFNREWENVKLGDVCEIKKGQDLSKEKLDIKGKNKCLLYGEIYTTYNEVVDSIKSRTNTDEGTKSKVGDVLIPASTTTSAMDLAVAITIQEDDILLGGDINILRMKNKNSFNNIFLAYYLTNSKKHELARLAQGITIVHLYGKDFKKLKIELPSIKEQTAIAKILTTADKEIEILEKKKKNIEEQKKYLLNNLITGKIRTV